MWKILFQIKPLGELFAELIIRYTLLLHCIHYTVYTVYTTDRFVILNVWMLWIVNIFRLFEQWTVYHFIMHFSFLILLNNYKEQCGWIIKTCL